MLTYREKLEKEAPFDLGASPNLLLSVRELLMEEVVGHVEDDEPTVSALAERIREEIPIHGVAKRDPFHEVAGADAGSHVLPLASRRYAVISALVYSLPSGNRFFLEPESLYAPYTFGGDRLGGVLNVRREAKLFETARSFIEKGSGARLLLVDGPLAFSNWWGMAGKEADRRRLVTAVRGLFETCEREGVIVAGVVKRPSARYLVYTLGLQGETELPDAFLLLHALRPGERTDIFSPRAAVRRAVREAPFMDAIGHPVYSFYIRLSREWSIPPVRIDVPVSSLGRLDDVADYCYGASYWEGVPLPIVKADEAVKISKRFIGEVYRDIVGRVGGGRGRVSQLAPYWGEGRWLGA